jgi:nicotinate dehydrogenase subunit A
MIDLDVNGHTYSISADPETPLLYVLRNDLQLNAAKFGCGLGQCGACTVLVDGAATLSCVTPILLLAGRQITTVEGLGSAEHPGPMQQAFLEEQAAQCGYCIAGMMMRAQVLLQKNPRASDAEIRAYLEPNLCRCGTHMRILRAVRRAASLMQAASDAHSPVAALPGAGAGAEPPQATGAADSKITPPESSAQADLAPSSDNSQQQDALRLPAHSDKRERPER